MAFYLLAGVPVIVSNGGLKFLGSSGNFDVTRVDSFGTGSSSGNTRTYPGRQLGVSHPTRKIIAIIATRTNTTTGSRYVTEASILSNGILSEGVQLVGPDSAENSPVSVWEFAVPNGLLGTFSMTISGNSTGIVSEIIHLYSVINGQVVSCTRNTDSSIDAVHETGDVVLRGYGQNNDGSIPTNLLPSLYDTAGLRYAGILNHYAGLWNALTDNTTMFVGVNGNRSTATVIRPLSVGGGPITVENAHLYELTYGDTAVINLPFTIPAGKTILLTFKSNTLDMTRQVSDPVHGTTGWFEAGSVIEEQNLDFRNRVCYWVKNNTSAPLDQITVTVSEPMGLPTGLLVVDRAVQFDKIVTANGFGTIPNLNFDAANANSLSFHSFKQSGDAPITGANGYVAVPSGVNEWNPIGYNENLGAAGTKTSDFTYSTNLNWSNTVAVFY